MKVKILSILYIGFSLDLLTKNINNKEQENGNRKTSRPEHEHHASGIYGLYWSGGGASHRLRYHLTVNEGSQAGRS